MLQDSDENEMTEHESMAALLWTDYNNRMMRRRMFTMGML
jgi:hypothetical protein